MMLRYTYCLAVLFLIGCGPGTTSQPDVNNTADSNMSDATVIDAVVTDTTADHTTPPDVTMDTAPDQTVVTDSQVADSSTPDAQRTDVSIVETSIRDVGIVVDVVHSDSANGCVATCQTNADCANSCSGIGFGNWCCGGGTCHSVDVCAPDPTPCPTGYCSINDRNACVGFTCCPVPENPSCGMCADNCAM